MIGLLKQSLLGVLAAFLSSQTTNANLISSDKTTKTLVVLDNWATTETHSIFFDHLRRTLGHEIDFSMAGSTQAFKFYDQYYYDNIILMAPSSKESEIADDLKVPELIKFFEVKGHNLMVAGDYDARRHIRKLANHFGIDFEGYGYKVKDESKQHSQVVQNSEIGEAVSSANFFLPLKELQTPVFGLSEPSQEVLYSGIGQILDENNQFVFPILRAESTSYSVNQNSKEGDEIISSVSGEQLTIVSGYQSRSNNRASFAGSIAMCSDAFLYETIDSQLGTLESSSNYQFCKQLLNWNFQESGVLKATNLRHNKKGDKCTESDVRNCGPNPENYMIEDHVEFYIEIEQKTEGKWAPYISDDIQLQFIMLDPYYKVFLDREGSEYTSKFRVPDRLGIFRFVIDHSRYGLTSLIEEQEVSVIQWRHDNFPRYLPRAYPFYASVFLMMAGFSLFIVFFLFSDFKQSQAQAQHGSKKGKVKHN